MLSNITLLDAVLDKLEENNLRQFVNAIEENGPGEVVIWCGCGHPVRSADEAVNIAARCRDEWFKPC